MQRNSRPWWKLDHSSEEYFQISFLRSKLWFGQKFVPQPRCVVLQSPVPSLQCQELRGVFFSENGARPEVAGSDQNLVAEATGVVCVGGSNRELICGMVDGGGRSGVDVRGKAGCCLDGVGRYDAVRRRRNGETRITVGNVERLQVWRCGKARSTPSRLQVATATAPSSLPVVSRPRSYSAVGSLVSPGVAYLAKTRLPGHWEDRRSAKRMDEVAESGRGS